MVRTRKTLIFLFWDPGVHQWSMNNLWSSFNDISMYRLYNVFLIVSPLVTCCTITQSLRPSACHDIPSCALNSVTKQICFSLNPIIFLVQFSPLTWSPASVATFARRNFIFLREYGKDCSTFFNALPVDCLEWYGVSETKLTALVSSAFFFLDLTVSHPISFCYFVGFLFWGRFLFVF